MANFSNFDVSDDTIFVQGLPEDTTDDQLAEFFGQIGIIKFDKKNNCKKIWIYKDKTTGKGKGEATITFDDPPTATSAINWFNGKSSEISIYGKFSILVTVSNSSIFFNSKLSGKEFRGSTLVIELAQRKPAPQFNRGGGRGGGGGGPRGGRAGFESRGPRDDRGGGGGGGGSGGAGAGRNRFDSRGPRDDRGGGGASGGRPGAGSGRPGDWLCPSCNNNNFAYRHECNRCRTQKPASAGGDSGGSHNGGIRGRRQGEKTWTNYGWKSRDSDRGRDRDRSRDRSRDRDRDRERDRDRDRHRERQR